MPRTAIVAANFEMFSGNTRVLKVNVLDQDEAVVDLTGATAEFIFAKRAGHEAIFSKTVGSGIVITDAANGLLEVTLAPADTETLSGAYYHELEVTDAGGRKTTVLFGTATVRRNVA